MEPENEHHPPKLYSQVLRAALGPLTHLQMGGDISDEAGQELVSQVVDAAMTWPQLAGPAQESAFTKAELCRIYTVMVECLMPEPIILFGTKELPVLAPTILYLQPGALRTFLGIASKTVGQKMGEDRSEAVTTISVEFIRGVYANSKHKPLERTKGKGYTLKQAQMTKSGCASATGVLVLCTLVVVLIAWGFL